MFTTTMWKSLFLAITLGMAAAREGVMVRQSGIWTFRETTGSESVAQAIDRYMNVSGVDRAEPNVYMKRFLEANDPSRFDQWALDAIRASDAWTLETGSSDVKICVVDSGIDEDHEDLAPNVIERTSFCDGCDSTDYSGHGTHIAGVIGAAGNNSLGVSGINWKTSILSCRFMNGDGGYLNDALQCLEWCIDRGAIASSHSYGIDFFSEAFYDVVARAVEKHVVVAAAGNHGSDLVFYPAGYDLPNVISVAATDPDGKRAGYSGYGWTVDIGAPGSGILSTHLANGYAAMTGTSMATPHVAGAVALVRAASIGRWDDMSARELRSIVVDSATRGVVDGIPDGRFLNLYEAVAAVALREDASNRLLNVAYGGSGISVISTNTSDQCRRSCLKTMGECFTWTFSIRERACNLIKNATNGIVSIGFVSGKIPFPPPLSRPPSSSQSPPSSSQSPPSSSSPSSSQSPPSPPQSPPSPPLSRPPSSSPSSSSSPPPTNSAQRKFSIRFF